MTLEHGVGLVHAALLFACEQGLKDVLANVAALTGFGSPNLGKRYFFMQKWAEAAGKVRVAIVARPEMIDSRRFGVSVAENHGMVANVFESEAEALGWLDRLRQVEGK